MIVKDILKQPYRTCKSIYQKFLFNVKNLRYDIHTIPIEPWMLEYKKQFLHLVDTDLHEFHESLKPFYQSKLGNNESMVYFEQQFTRFCKIIEICEKFRIQPVSVGDIASYYPYATYWFHLKYGADVTCYDIIHRCAGASLYDNGKVRLVDCDITVDSIGKHKLYVFSASIEHIPCNLYKLCQKIVDAMPKGAYLYVCYPTGGKNAKDYEVELPLPTAEFHGHLREFTYETTRWFFNQLKVVYSERIIVPCAGYTEEYLYQKV